jgi:hypothetical protein
MKHIQLPDGSIAQFPDDMNDAAIEQVLQQEHAAPPAPSPVAPTRASQYNTPLSPEDQAGFEQWSAQLGQTRKENANAFEPWMNQLPGGTDTSRDMEDYDLKGAFAEGLSADGRGHLPDTYKKPWHPTFSEESKYSKGGTEQGGKWIDKGDDKWDFEASPTNLKYHSPDELKRYFARVEPDSNVIMPPTPAKKEYEGSAVDPFMQAVTFEFGDEMKGAVSALKDKIGGDKRSFSELYGEDTDAIRAGMKKFTEEHAVQSLLGTVAGSIVGPGGPGRIALKGLRGASRIPAIAEALVTGGVGGLLSGLGAGEDSLESRAGGAAEGGLLGAASGGLLSGAGSAAKHVWRTLVPGNVRKVGERVLAQALSRRQPGGLSELLQRFDALRTDGTPAVLADTSKGASDLARTVHARPSAGSEDIEDFLNQRAAGASGRIRTALRRDVSSANPNVTIDDLRDAQRTASGPAYERAYASGPIYDDEVGRLLTNPHIRRGIRDGIDIERNNAMAENRPFNLRDYAITGFNDAGDPIIEGVPNVRLLDAAKRGLDDQLDKYRNAVTGRLELDQHGRSIDRLRRKLLERMDAGSDDYRIARETYAEPQESINAVGAGRSFMRGDYDRAGERFSGLTPENQDYYRAGVARELEDVTRKGRPTSDHATTLLNENTWSRLDQILPADRAARLRATLGREQTLNRTLRKVTQGSPTARITAGQDDAESMASSVATAAVDASSFGAGTALRNLLRRGNPGTAGGLTEGLADYLAPRLLTSDRGEIESMQRVLMDRLTKDARRSSLIASAQGGVPVGLFGSMTRNSFGNEDRR